MKVRSWAVAGRRRRSAATLGGGCAGAVLAIQVLGMVGAHATTSGCSLSGPGASSVGSSVCNVTGSVPSTASAQVIPSNAGFSKSVSSGATGASTYGQNGSSLYCYWWCFSYSYGYGNTGASSSTTSAAAGGYGNAYGVTFPGGDASATSAGGSSALAAAGTQGSATASAVNNAAASAEGLMNGTATSRASNGAASASFASDGGNAVAVAGAGGSASAGASSGQTARAYAYGKGSTAQASAGDAWAGGDPTAVALGSANATATQEGVSCQGAAFAYNSSQSCIGSSTGPTTAQRQAVINSLASIVNNLVP